MIQPRDQRDPPGLFEIGCLGRIARTRLPVGEQQPLSGHRVGLLRVGDRPVQPDLRLTLVGDHVRGLLGEPLMLLSSFLDGLLQLHLGVGELVLHHMGLHGEVLPPPLHRSPHRHLRHGVPFFIEVELPPAVATVASGFRVGRRTCRPPRHAYG